MNTKNCPVVSLEPGDGNLYTILNKHGDSLSQASVAVHCSQDVEPVDARLRVGTAVTWRVILCDGL